MTIYESTFICSPELPADKLEELVEKAKKTVENSGGQILLLQQLGKKKLSYPIEKFREGSYVYMELTGTGEMLNSLENFYKVTDSVMRFLTVKRAKKPQARPPVEKTEAAASPSEEVKSDELKQS